MIKNIKKLLNSSNIEDVKVGLSLLRKYKGWFRLSLCLEWVLSFLLPFSLFAEISIRDDVGDCLLTRVSIYEYLIFRYHLNDRHKTIYRTNMQIVPADNNLMLVPTPFGAMVIAISTSIINKRMKRKKSNRNSIFSDYF